MIRWVHQRNQSTLLIGTDFASIANTGDQVTVAKKPGSDGENLIFFD
ncbi:MAG: hypothetical protein AAGJ83_11940 [Planctomycetota bacterium]